MVVKVGSAWDRLTACMMKASNMDKRVNVFLNYQLTEARAALGKAVRKVKSDGNIAGYSIDQNGRIKIEKNGETKYEAVKSVEHMNGMLVN